MTIKIRGQRIEEKTSRVEKSANSLIEKTKINEKNMQRKTYLSF